VIIVLVTIRDKRPDAGKTTAVSEQKGSMFSASQTLPEPKPTTKIIEPAPTKPPVDLEGSEGFNEEGLKKAQEGKFAEGAELFTKAIKANPNNAKAWNNLGLAMRKLGKIDEAVKAYRQAIQAQPDFALAYKNLGIALEQAGDKNGAAQAYNKYCQLDPSAPDRATVQQRAEQLKR
jgi:Flp pilus assembly protein TadD